MEHHEEPHKLNRCRTCSGEGTVNRDYDDLGHLRSWEGCPECKGFGFIRAPLTSTG